MQRIGFYAGRNRSDDLLHVETDGCIVNIRVGLTDHEGRQVTSVTVLPDDETRGGDGEGRIWRQDGSRIIRLHEHESGAEPDADAAWPPVAGSGDPGYDEAAQQELDAPSPMPAITGWIESFEIRAGGDVLLWVNVPSEGIHEPIMISRAELAGIAEASAVQAG